MNQFTFSLTELSILAALALGTLLLLARIQRVYRAFVLKQRWSRARIKETQAASLLRELGYEICGSQVEASYELVVDGFPQRVPLRADYVVNRQGRSYVAEVKSGDQASRLTTRATRRQLLEYLVAFPVDGVLLVNAETQRVHRVDFPLPAHVRQPAPTGTDVPWQFWMLAFLLLAFGAAFVYIR